MGKQIAKRYMYLKGKKRGWCLLMDVRGKGMISFLGGGLATNYGFGLPC